ncbi:MAG: esterase family protein [Clostridia bacterium]|nr:esterase family protein [Clostridia bacterium]
MEMQYIRSYSSELQRDMECKIYGHAGRPVLFVPCQDGRFFDFENFRMTDTWAPFIESGKVMVLAIDTIDKETWSDAVTPAYDRIRRHEAWMRYIVNEAVPMIQSIAKERNGQDSDTGVIAFGCSLGATHAANLFLRFPDKFCGLLALSGIYTAEYGFGNYMDEVVFENSPVHYIESMPWHHPYVEKYNSGRGIICVGTGAWEETSTTFRLKELFEQKGINIWVDIWGSDVNHDWPWWHRQVEYFVPKLLED